MAVGEGHLKLSAGGRDAIKPETTVLLENQFWFVATITTQLSVQLFVYSLGFGSTQSHD